MFKGVYFGVILVMVSTQMLGFNFLFLRSIVSVVCVYVCVGVFCLFFFLLMWIGRCINLGIFEVIHDFFGYSIYIKFTNFCVSLLAFCTLFFLRKDFFSIHLTNLHFFMSVTLI